MYILHTEGVRRRGLSFPWLARVFSTNAAKLFGLHPRKGSLLRGADADVVVFDPEPTWTLEPSALHMQADWSPYRGREVAGRVRVVLRRGEVVLDEAGYRAAPGSGDYLRRKPESAALQSAGRVDRP